MPNCPAIETETSRRGAESGNALHANPFIPQRFHFAESTGDANTSVLARWWQAIGVPGLDCVIEKLLVQSIGIARARQWAQAKVDSNPPRGRGSDAAAFAMHNGIIALAEFQGVRLREIAACARDYVCWLLLSEKIGNFDRGLSFLREAALRAKRDPARYRIQPYAVSALIADFDAGRERLREARDRRLVDLSERLGEPLDVTSEFLRRRALPEAPASRPQEGTPAQMLLRRPDLIAAMHATEASKLCPGVPDAPDAFDARLAFEQATLRAHGEIERAMRSFQARITEIVPLRAELAVFDALAGKISEAAESDGAAFPALIQHEYQRYMRKDREIEARGGSYLAAIDLYEALGAGWESEQFEQEAASDGYPA